MTDTALYLATFANAAMPGPCAILAASRTVRGGVRSGLMVSAGVIVGIAALTGLAFGMMAGAVSVSDRALVAMKWAGAAALLLLAVRLLRAAPSGSPRGRRPAANTDFGAGAVVAMFSPFVLVFLVALLPQFVSPGTSAFAPALLAAAVFIVGAAAAQAGAILFGACSLGLGGASFRWVERASAILLLGFAGAAVMAPVGLAILVASRNVTRVAIDSRSAALFTGASPSPLGRIVVARFNAPVGTGPVHLHRGRARRQ
jgi:threonine/homoserine/homoserine lactone efflux protein